MLLLPQVSAHSTRRKTSGARLIVLVGMWRTNLSGVISSISATRDQLQPERTRLALVNSCSGWNHDQEVEKCGFPCSELVAELERAAALLPPLLVRVTRAATMIVRRQFGNSAREREQMMELPFVDLIEARA